MKLTRAVRHNIIANFTGNVSRGIFNLAFIPVYIQLMGVEAYALIGIFMSLSAIFVLLDMGLSTTLSRQLSRLSVIEGSEYESRNLVRTFEIVYWCIGGLIGALVIILAPFIAKYWINSTNISIEIVEQTLLIMGMLLAFQWPRAIYIGGLEGLQQQVLYNIIKTFSMLARHVGAVLVLIFISPSIINFFYWQSFIALITTIILAVSLWRSLPKSNKRSRFDKALFVKNWKFVSGVIGISLGTILLAQVDKIILSKVLTLEVFGYYMLATTIATLIMSLVSPIHTALFPRFSQLVVKKEENKISDLYRRGCQLASIIILPFTVTMAFFSKEILYFWIGNKPVVDNTYMLLSLLLIATTIKAFMTLPYALQLAHGWTKLAFYKNIITVIIMVPSMLWIVQIYQGIGAAFVLISLNLGMLIAEIIIMHKRILNKFKRRYIYDVLVPILIVSGIGFIIHEIYEVLALDESKIITFLIVFCTLCITFIGSALATGNLNTRVLSLLKIKDGKKLV